MTKGNICPNCKYAIPQKYSGLGLVDCPVRCCGNSYQTECEHFRVNENLRRLKESAISAIKKLERLYTVLIDGNDALATEIMKAATYSCAMQEAYAIMIGISYDMASEILHEEATNPA